MPREGKGKRKSQRDRRSPPPKNGNRDREEDLESLASDFTETTGCSDNEEEVEVEVTDDNGEAESEKYLSLLKTAIEDAQEKRQTTRLKGLEELKRLLLSRCAEEDELDNLVITLSDIIDRSVRKGGNATEKITAAKLAALLMIVSLNCSEGVNDTVYKSLQPGLIQMASDSAQSSDVREEMCKSVAVLGFFGAVEYVDLQTSINALYNVFSKALPKGDGTLPSLSQNQLKIHSAALQGFFLLLTITDRDEVLLRSPTILDQMLSVLETKELEMRLEVGTGVALVYELVGDHDRFKWPKKKQLLAIIEELATDSQKHRAKKDRQKQRSFFRTIETYLLDGYYEPEEITLASKKMKTILDIVDWSARYRYETLVHVLGTVFNSHFIRNEGLHSYFEFQVIDSQNISANNRVIKADNLRISKYKSGLRKKDRDFKATKVDAFDEE